MQTFFSSFFSSRAFNHFIKCSLLASSLPLGPLVKADSICLLNDPVDAALARYDLATKAKSELNIAYYSIGGEGDISAIYGLAVLRDTVRRGVKVRLLVDAMFNQISKSMCAHLINEGVEIRVFHPFNPLMPLRHNRRLHDKLFITDRTRLITGGRNIDDTYFDLHQTNRNRVDRDILVEGETALLANDYFMSIWDSKLVSPVYIGRYRCLVQQKQTPIGMPFSRRRAPPPLHRMIFRRDLNRAGEQLDVAWESLQLPRKGKDGFRDIDWEKHLKPVDSIRFLADPGGRKLREQNTVFHITNRIQQAVPGEKIWIESPYFILTRRTHKVLSKALARGVRVVVLTNSINSTENLLVQAVYQYRKPAYLSMGIEIYEFSGAQNLQQGLSLHSKSIVFEKAGVGIVGSFNIDPRSEFFNTEVAVEFNSKDLADDLLKSIKSRINKKAVRIGIDGLPVNGQPRFFDATHKKIRRMKLLTYPALMFDFLL